MEETRDKPRVARYARRLEAEARWQAKEVYGRALMVGAFILLIILMLQMTPVGQYLPIEVKLAAVGLLFFPVMRFLRTADTLDNKAALAGWGAEAEEQVNDTLEDLKNHGWVKWNNKMLRDVRGADLDIVLKSPRGFYYVIEVKANYRRAQEEPTQRRVKGQAVSVKERTKSNYYVVAIVCFPDSPGAPAEVVLGHYFYATPLSQLIPLLTALDKIHCGHYFPRLQV